MSMQQFFTREQANILRKLELTLPNGDKSDEYLIVNVKDSDAYELAQAVAQRKMVESLDLDNTEAKVRARISIERELIADLISDWSFEAECSLENKVDFLHNAPSVQEQIDVFSARRQSFFDNESEHSSGS